MRSITCTDQMPAKRHYLPHPYPECESDHGSIRIGVIAGSSGKGYGPTRVIIRIKHYNPVGYAATKRKIKNPFSIENDIQLKKELMRNQQKWCSFRIEDDFAFQCEPRTESVFNFLDDGNHLGRKSIEWKPSEFFINAVKKYGWNNLPKYSDRYKIRHDKIRINFNYQVS